ncbi:hypothetical protein FOPG_02761 [Fusarium oxysporum f. sp. conglutinans race 2 54008]|uniref:Uncharacterized protein n=2 Tax=Fusarium oxysporum TaxID=5507 RepID=X0MU00_FUSOX|nr:hypothetical protein FOPG_02761 [Fusarium oxysporum f. sp. conglutinans race 2 54008]EXM37197.1 hypothetical protein FOTG_00998 [Fusarium oxysporum f. sp. vasinfectum 25433]KAI8415404.1 hypothetical protein FOFC_05026 [Fusarium oxysporum]KAJ0151535.1 hypothetical protein HZ326_6017 [Fusarium oxysporum f. sp. albedinis]
MRSPPPSNSLFSWPKAERTPGFCVTDLDLISTLSDTDGRIITKTVSLTCIEFLLASFWKWGFGGDVVTRFLFSLLAGRINGADASVLPIMGKPVSTRRMTVRGYVSISADQCRP